MERLNFGISAGAVAAGFALASPAFAASLAAGAAIEALNFRALRNGAAQLFGGNMVAGRLWAMGFGVRFAFLAVAISLALGAGAHPVALVLGLSTTIPAVVIGAWLQRRLTPKSGSAERHRFVEGFVASSLLFCTGPLTILGSLNDGLGRGADELYLKAALDGFAALAFAASFGWGVAASALTVLVVQGGLTLVGVLLGDVLPDAHVAALTAVGGLLLVGVALRLLRVRQIPVADLLPALIAAPLLVAFAAAIR